MNAKTDSRQVGPYEVMLLAGGAIVAILEGGLWLWTGLTGAVFGSGSPHLTLGALWKATSGVADHLSDPRQGFARPVRAGPPGPAAFDATLFCWPHSPGDRRLDQTRPPRRHHHRPPPTGRGARRRPVRTLGPAQPHLDTPGGRPHLERCPGDGAADGVGG